jgi:hypothetical protein
MLLVLPADMPTIRSLTSSTRTLAIAAAAIAVVATSPATASATASAGQAQASPLALPTGPVLFDGSTLAGWYVQDAAANRIQMVADPSGAAGQVMSFTAYNTDVAPLTPTANPRAQLTTPLPVKPGAQFWESYEVYVPTNFPIAASYDGWLGLGSPAFGPPWGVPTIGMSITDGDFRYQRNGDQPNPWQIAWQQPIVTGQWIRFTWHVGFSKTGFVQLYVNDVAEPLLNGTTSSTTLHMPVIDSGNDIGPWISQLSVYYEKDLYPSVTLYFKGFTIATTQAAAE